MKFGKRGEMLLDVVAIGLTAELFIIAFGRAINSPTAVRLRNAPLIGKPLTALAGAHNQVYDPAGEN